MKLTHIAATIYAMGWGRHIAIAPAIAAIAGQQIQLRKMQRQFKKTGKTQAAEL